MAYVKKRSVLPVYFIGGTWLLWSVFAPLYRPVHYIMAALASLIAYYGGKMLFPDQGYEVKDAPQPPPEPETQTGPGPEKKPKSTGNPEIDALLAERDRAVGEMRRLNDSIKDEKISRQIDQLEATTLKLLNAYDRMDSTGVSGSNIDGTKGKVEGMLDTICAAFSRQLDDLYGDEAMDISAEITVMEQMLAQEGFGGMTLGGK